MSTETITDPEVVLDGAPPCWPPVAHLIRKEDEPAREGTVAFCGAKLMGIDLGRLRTHNGKVCEQCVAAARRELGL